MDYLKNAKFGTKPDLLPLKEFSAWFNIIRGHGINQAEITANDIAELLKKTGITKLLGRR